MSPVQISFMEHKDIRESARVLSLAMLDAALHVAIFQGKGEPQRIEIETMFTGLLQTLPGIVFLAKSKGEIVGVMRMKSCVGSPPEKAPEEDPAPPSRKTVWQREWALKDPREQHWHLGPIGVLPAHQGTGIGSALMDRFCREVDRCAAFAYLETDSDKNVRFYEKFGFCLTSTSTILGVENRYMTRDVQPGV